MPTLEWIGKDKVINHHQQVPYRVLERRYSYDAGGQHDDDNGSENMVIRGDNLEALKALLPRYEGKVKCIYIDPPYNTAHSTDDNRRWVYNDNVDSVEMKRWFGKVVGDEGEDLSRHDKWLCMMYPRLKLLQRLLSNDGIIFISINDAEHARLKLICDEIFGINNFVSNVIWQNNYSPRNDAKDITYVTDNILAYSKRPGWHPRRLIRTGSMDARYTTPDNDPIPWTSSPAHAPSARTHKGMVYAIQHPYTGEFFYPPSGRCWAQEQPKVLALMREWADYKLQQIDDAGIRAAICGENDVQNMPEVMAIILDEPLEISREKVRLRHQQGCWPTFYFTSQGTGGLRVKKHIDSMGGKAVTTLWPYSEVGSNTEAKNELKEMFNGSVPFDTPKPVRLIQRILHIATDADSIVLDSFAGSASTAQAILTINKEQRERRRFILIEMMDYAESLTAERTRRVISGYTTSDDIEEIVYDKEITIDNLIDGQMLLDEAKLMARESREHYDKVSKPKIEDGHLRVVGTRKSMKNVSGTGGDFSFYDLGEVLLLPNGNLNENIGTERIREYVWYMETKTPYTTVSECDNPYYLGMFSGAAYYFYYEKGRATTLDYAFLNTIQTRAENHIIYADTCEIPVGTLKSRGVIFKKIPRDIAKL